MDWFSRENLHRGPITFFGGFRCQQIPIIQFCESPSESISPVVDVNWSSTQSSNGSSGITSSICERWQRWGKFFGWSAGKSYGLVSVLVNICSEDLVKQMLVLNIYIVYIWTSIVNHWWSLNWWPNYVELGLDSVSHASRWITGDLVHLYVVNHWLSSANYNDFYWW